jgi:hypothetical protein
MQVQELHRDCAEATGARAADRALKSLEPIWQRGIRGLAEPMDGWFEVCPDSLRKHCQGCSRVKDRIAKYGGLARNHDPNKYQELFEMQCRRSDNV